MQAPTSSAHLGALTFGLEAILLLLLGGAAWILYRSMKATRTAVDRFRDLSARQEAIFDAATDGMIITDSNGNIESLNPAAARMWGYNPNELLGRNLRFLIDGAPTEAEVQLFLDKVAKNVSGRATRAIEFTARRHDGTTFTADIATSAVPLRDDLHFLGVVRDVSDRKRVERMKTEFVSTVSHELRTPLTSIAGSLGLLSAGAAGSLPERAEKLIRIAHANSERLVRLINDILDIEKIESGKMNFVTKPVPLRPLVEQAIQANFAFAEGYGVRLTLAADASGDATALADADRLMQVLTNLLSNASKFSPKGSEVVTTIVAGETSHRITIRDQGPGIPKEFNDRIFSKFAQADASDTREKGGTGLGLSIVKQIVEGLGGSVSFDSELGKGTAFHIDLPALFTPKKADERQILICQEDMTAAEEIKETLRRAGFSGDVAPSCHDVRKFTAEKTYAAIILDLTLPGDQSISLIRDLRSDPRHASVPILVATSDGSSEVSQAIAVVDWLHKPISADKLVKGVQKAIPEDDRPRILHVEDDIDILGIVASAFEGRAILESVTDLDEARTALKERYYDLVILDLALPGGSGLELLPVMHRDDGKPIPVVIFSAQDEDPELAKRVEALLTKSRASLDDLVETVETLIAMYMKKSDKG